MRRPSQYHLGTVFLFIFFNSNQVGESLQRMTGSGFHGEYRLAGILDELIQNLFGIIILAVLKMSERTHTDDITIRSHHRNSLQQMFTLIAIHNDTALCFQLPCTLIHIEYNHIHPQVTSCLLGTQTGTQTVVEENQQTSLMLSQGFIFVAVFLDFESFGKGTLQVAQIMYVCKVSHNPFIYIIIVLFVHPPE